MSILVVLVFVIDRSNAVYECTCGFGKCKFKNELEVDWQEENKRTISLVLEFDRLCAIKWGDFWDRKECKNCVAEA